MIAIGAMAVIVIGFIWASIKRDDDAQFGWILTGIIWGTLAFVLIPWLWNFNDIEKYRPIPIDGGNVYNEKSFEEMEWYVVSDGKRISINEDGGSMSKNSFEISYKNEATKICEGAPKWLSLYSLGEPCHWKIEAVNP